MTDYSRDFDLLHPLLIEQIARLAEQAKAQLVDGSYIKPICSHRTPQQQFEIFKKGREKVDGDWIVENKNQIQTNKDGFDKLSRHNYLPALAVDFGLMKMVHGMEDYAGNSPAYKEIGPIAEALGFEWGGCWTSPYDPGHVQVSINRLPFQNLERGVAAVWQDMLKAAGYYRGEVDGYFGQISSDALAACVGSSFRSPASYKKLLAAYCLEAHS